MLMTIDKRPTVALIWGGRGYERDVSRRGMENILPQIDKNTYNVLSVHIDKSGEWTLDGKSVYPSFPGGIVSDGGFIKIDCALPLLHGNFGEDGRVQGALDCALIKYIGCDSMTSGICRDKFVVKSVARTLGIPTLPCTLVLRGEDINRAAERYEKEIGYPAFVKPTSLGSSLGAAGADNRTELLTALDSALRLCDRAIVERRISPKRELECGYFAAKGKEIFTKCGEILQDGFYSYEKKYLNGGAGVCVVADVSNEIDQRIRDYSRRLTHALGVRDISRIDYFLSGDKLYFNEINTMPGMTKTSLYQAMIEAEGVPSAEFVNLLIEEVLSSR